MKIKKYSLIALSVITLSTSAVVDAQSEPAGNYHLTQGSNGSLLLEPTDNINSSNVFQLKVDTTDNETSYVFTPLSDDGATTDPEKPEVAEYVVLGPASLLEYAKGLCASYSEHDNNNWHVLRQSELDGFSSSDVEQPFLIWMEGTSMVSGKFANTAIGSPYSPYYVSPENNSSIPVVCSAGN